MILTLAFLLFAADPAQQFVGTWRLVASRQTLTDGSTRPDPQTGATGSGYLIYTSAGRVCAVTANPDRPKWRDETAPTRDELQSTIAGMVAYCGTFTVDERTHVVTHKIEIDSNPNRIGSERKRAYQFRGNRLTLRPVPPLPAGITDWTIEWERVPETPK